MANNFYKNIMVPFDGSKFAQNALDTAKRLAASFGSTLHIVTVVDISSVASPGLIRSEDRKVLEQIRKSAIQSARKIAGRKAEECNLEKIKTSASVLEGSAANELLGFVRKNHIDLVVIGSQGLAGMSRVKALGSVSRRISELAPCPVMIIH